MWGDSEFQVDMHRRTTSVPEPEARRRLARLERHRPELLPRLAGPIALLLLGLALVLLSAVVG